MFRLSSALAARFAGAAITVSDGRVRNTAAVTPAAITSTAARPIRIHFFAPLCFAGIWVGPVGCTGPVWNPGPVWYPVCGPDWYAPPGGTTPVGPVCWKPAVAYGLISVGRTALPPSG